MQDDQGTADPDLAVANRLAYSPTINTSAFLLPLWPWAADQQHRRRHMRHGR